MSCWHVHLPPKTCTSKFSNAGAKIPTFNNINLAARERLRTHERRRLSRRETYFQLNMSVVLFSCSLAHSRPVHFWMAGIPLPLDLDLSKKSFTHRQVSTKHFNGHLGARQIRALLISQTKPIFCFCSQQKWLLSRSLIRLCVYVVVFSCSLPFSFQLSA